MTNGEVAMKPFFTALLVLFGLALLPHALFAGARTTIAAVNLSIELPGEMMELTDENGADAGQRHVLLMEPERNFVLRIEERKRPYDETLKFVRGSYVPEAGLKIAESEEISISGKRANILVSAPEEAEPKMRQSILVLGDAKNSIFACVVYPATDREAVADARKMFLSVRWPAKK